MSGLGNLFSGFSADSNDALKYSAPKEPKQRAPKPSTSPVPDRQTPVAAAAPVTVAAAAPKAAGPSKIMASAAVRLYKVNPSTGAYDALEGGGLLGCVMMGTGLTFQILIYNGQKVPQATVSVGAAFDYALRDLYMSFADAAGNQWSLLFDSLEVMNNFVRTVAATVVHVVSHGDGGSGGGAVVKRSLPRAATDDDATTLSMGMSAGVYLTAWELQEVADYPGDIIAGAPLKRVQSPDDVVKIKLSATDELIGGLSEGLVGCNKGDRVVLGVPPKVFYRGSAEGPIDLTKRAFPGSWMFLEVEVSKIKSAEKKSNKDKDKKPFVEETAVSQAPMASPVQNNVQRLAQRTSFTEHSDGGSEIAARMARLASQSGGGMQLAGIMQGNSGGNIQQRSPSSQQHKQTDDHSGGGGGNFNSNANHSSSNNNGGGNTDYSNQHQQGQSQRQHVRNNSNNSNYDGNHSYQQQGNQHGNQQFHSQQNQQQYNNNSHNNSNHSQQQQYQENRVAVIEGQGARSYYDTDDAGMDSHNNHQYYNGNNSHNQQQQQAYRNLNSGRPAPAPVQSTHNDASLTQLHTSVAAVQQSMLQLHTKMDQVSTQVTSSVALQQQQLVTSGASGAGSLGMATVNAMGTMGMGNMGMNPYMQQQMQFQQQLMAQQQQQQQQQMMGMSGMHMPAALPSASIAGASSVRIKTEELVSTLQTLLVEYEKNSSNGGGSNKAIAEAQAREAECRDTIRGLKSSVERIEEKHEALQARYDKVMTEKADLMEKYMEQFQTGSTANSRVQQMQAELEPLRAANKDLQAQVDTLRATVSSAGSSNKQQEQEQKTLIAELKNKAMTLEMELMEARQAVESSKTSASSELSTLQVLTQQQQIDLTALRAETTQLQGALQAAESATQRAVADAVAEAQAAAASKETALRQELTAQHAAALEAALATANAGASSAQDSGKVTELEAQVSELRTQLAKSQDDAASLNLALDSVAAKATESNDLHSATMASLQRQLDAAQASAASAGASSGKADADDLKAIMQEVFTKACEVFNPEAEDAAEAQYSTQDIVKRLKAVLKRVTSEHNTA